jgi:hypothetical protein
MLAVVMVLQRLKGLSDREAANRFAFDVRWRYATGLADAVPEDRIFRIACQLPRQAGLAGCSGCWTPHPWKTRSPPRIP